MKKPLIFSGTTEGRHMSERLSRAGIDHIVCVATAYGGLVMSGNAHADIRCGRLDETAMIGMISKEADRVFDATHPYASAVSENIRNACAEAGADYIRILRGDPLKEKADAADQDVKDDGGTKQPPLCDGTTRVFADAESCAAALRNTEGNILLTTGSKELGVYAADPELRERLFVRVLPSEESIRLCGEAGIRGRYIIAMQGPFSAELDTAVINQYGIRTLVTKSSGAAGGFEEKLEAARRAGISAYVIGRPAEETGVSVNEALAEYFGIAPHIHIDLVATGPGRTSLLTDEARDAIRKADIISGAPRMVEPYPDKESYPYFWAKDIIPIIERKMPERVAVLFSGDTGYYSGTDMIRPELESWLSEKGYSYDIVIHPGVSSFSYLAAKSGISYTYAAMESLHGRSKDAAVVSAVLETIKKKEKTFLILSGAEDVRLLGRLLLNNGLAGCRVIVGRELSYPDEMIAELSPAECEAVTEKGLYTALILNSPAGNKAIDPAVYKAAGSAGSEMRPDAEPGKDASSGSGEAKGGGRVIPVIGDEEFIRGRVPMTKENIRHLSVLKLDLREASVVWDVGSGTGSLACEIASLGRGIKVYAIEMKDEACGLIRQNAERFGLSSIHIIKGEAPEALEGLEAPTHVFIGGSSGRLKDIINLLEKLVKEGAGRSIRVVINAVSLETIAEINSAVRSAGAEEVLIEQISVSRSRELGDHHLMTAENPVMIASFTLGGKR